MSETGKKARWRNIFTIPNLMSLFRLCLIPAIIHQYCTVQNTCLAVLLIALSALTDILDGKIARRFNMVSDVGKVLDPIADKLTQAALIICLISRYKWALGLVILFAVREVIVGTLGYFTLTRAHCVNSAKWYGKAATVTIYAVMMALILFPEIPEPIANLLFGMCAAVIVFACIMYCRFYRKFLSDNLERPVQKRRLIVNILLLCVWAAIIILCIYHRDAFTVDGIVRLTTGNSHWAALIMLALFALKSVSLIIYGSLLYAASGILFPLPIAVAVNLLGTVIMVTIPYLIGEKAGAEKVRNLVAKHPRAAMLQNMQRRNDFFFCFLIRLSGLISSDLGGAYMGAVGISFLPYLAGSLLGMLPNMITFPIMGMNIRNIYSPEFLIAAGIQIGFTLLSIAFYALHRKRKCTDA